MKISMFHLMPYRDLPADFEQRYHSVWVDPPWHELGDAKKVGQYYNWTLDELIHAAKSGMDGICAGNICGSQQRRNIEIAKLALRWTNTHRFVS